MAANRKNRRAYPTLQLSESFGIAIESFYAHKVRFLLTALGMVIGTASLILVVTIGLTGKQYILQQIQAIGTNMMVVTSGVSSVYSTESARDDLTLNDLTAVRERVPNIIAASPKIAKRNRAARLRSSPRRWQKCFMAIRIRQWERRSKSTDYPLS